MNSKLISIVIPIYNEEKNIPMVVSAIRKVFSGSEYGHEIIFVNDGSKDSSILELNKLSMQDKNIKVLDFSRNFGKEVATSAGCHFAKGDAVITMDGDLQHPPELILEFLKKWEGGAEVVYTVRQENQGASFVKNTTSKVYWWIFSKISSMEMEPHSTDFRLMDRKVIEVFKKFPERGRLFRGIVDWMGYKREKIEFIAPERKNGKATYAYRKLLHLAINSITAFSLMPLRLAGYLGVFITTVSFILLLVMLITEIFNTLVFTIMAFIVVSNTLLIGIVLMCLGFIALYIARIHDEVVNRPLYIVRNKINLE